MSDPVLDRLLGAFLPLRIDDGADLITRDTQRRAAVLLPFIKRPSGWHLLYTQRPETMPNHAGQIAFPGGKVELDESAAEAALRETEEEVGIPPSAVQLIGRLPSFDASGTFRVTPFAGIVDPGVEIVIDKHEVAEAFEVPLSWLMDPRNHEGRPMEWGGETHTVWYMPYDGPDGVHRNIWGMTAGMTRRVWNRGFRDADAA